MLTPSIPPPGDLTTFSDSANVHTPSLYSREAFADDPYSNWVFDKSKVRNHMPNTQK